jgi:hypothetical protein
MNAKRFDWYDLGVAVLVGVFVCGLDWPWALCMVGIALVALGVLGPVAEREGQRLADWYRRRVEK